jgi:hypothetical protein
LLELLVTVLVRNAGEDGNAEDCSI